MYGRQSGLTRNKLWQASNLNIEYISMLKQVVHGCASKIGLQKWLKAIQQGWANKKQRASYSKQLTERTIKNLMF